jgi:tRNA-dihydrouridine synthase A
MLDWTDRHARYLFRLISRHAWLYTEMVTTGALIYGEREKYLAYNMEEHPLALQLGGSDPQHMAQCSLMAEDSGYDEVNINVGCPSDRVMNGQFGACLMATPEQVAECVSEMRNKVSIPVTIKTRIGIDDQDDYETLQNFVLVNQAAGCETFIIHARKAWLKGLSPRENRDVPPLNYERVYQLKRDFPQLEIIINGGLNDLDAAVSQLDHVDGAMMGRAVYHNPWILHEVDQRFFGAPELARTQSDIVDEMIEYIRVVSTKGTELKHVTRHMLGMYHGLPGARKWRRLISERACKAGAGVEVLEEAMAGLKAQGF